MIPLHERRILEAHVRGVSLNRLSLDVRPLDEYQQKDLRSLIKLRMQGIPVQYLVGSQNFYGRDFYVNTNVLIPRPETEGLVSLVLENLLTKSALDKSLHALDFGTGSGCIALTLALERPNLEVLATDCSVDALKVAEENASRLRVHNIEFREVSAEPQIWQYENAPRFDVIVSNPPYLVESDEVSEEVRTHEPNEALFPPEERDGLYFYKFLLELCEFKLSEGGFAVFEVAAERSAETADLFYKAGFNCEIRKDLANRDRYLLIRTWKEGGGLG